MKIRVGLLGFGCMGQVHAKVYQVLPNVELVGIVDSYAGTEALAREMKIEAPIASSLTTLLESVDVIDICLPTDLHAETIITAARAKKHVFCEKPLTLEVADAERALKAVEENNVAFQVGQCIRFWPEYQALEKFIKSGDGGKLVSLALQRRNSRPTYSRDHWLLDAKRSQGGAFDLHIHDTDFILHLLGKPQGVHSVGRLEKKGGWSRIFTHYLFDGLAVTAEGAWDLPPRSRFQMAFQAVFENAVIDFDTLTSPTLHLTLGEGPRQPMAFEQSSSSTIADLGGYYQELAYFYGRLLEGKKPEIATGRQTLESVRTVLAEIESAASGKVVKL